MKKMKLRLSRKEPIVSFKKREKLKTDNLFQNSVVFVFNFFSF